MAAGSKGIVDTSADADAVLSVLKSSMKGAEALTQDRVCAAQDPRSTEEGLALLGAYVAIDAPDVRQAILDAVLMIAAAARTKHNATR